MLNHQVAAVFFALAWRTSLAGEPVFKTVAYRKVARALAAETRSISDLAQAGALRTIPGVGDKIEAKIQELLDSGRLRALDRLRKAAPVAADRPPRVAVVGSCNMDLVAWAPRRPARGESLAGTRFAMFPGGKGFNQAVAAARLGAAVTFVSRVGNDSFGRTFLDTLKAEGVDARHLSVDPRVATGVGLPLVEPDGANSIVVVLGSNLNLATEHVAVALESIATADVLLLQLEVPQAASLYAAEAAEVAGVPVILNPAPVQPLLPELLGLADWLVPNEVEEAMLSGTDGMPSSMARLLVDAGARRVVVTIGAGGCLLADAEGERSCPAFPVEAVDSTAAGDVFCAALAVAVAKGWAGDVERTLRFANAAGALAVTVAGALPSLPRLADVESLLAGGLPAPAKENK